MTTTRRLVWVWTALVALTVGSFAVGIERTEIVVNGATVLILTSAMIKVRLIGQHFMDLRSAPWPLRAAFECYVVVVLITLAVLAMPWLW